MPGLGKEAEQQRKLFIGGLDYRTTDDSLKTFYEQWGEIVDVIVMKDPKTKRSRGFGFVTYSDPEMVDDAMNNRPHVVDGREVEAKRAVPRDASGGHPENNVTVKKVFVGGIKDNIQEDDLREYFGGFGEIVAVNMPADKLTGKMRGFAFIEFTDYDAVDKIILRRDHQVNGRTVDVKKALSKQEMADLSAGGGGRGGRGGFRGGRGGGASWGEGGRAGGRGGGQSWGGGGGWGGQQSNPWDNGGSQWGQGGYGGGYGQQGGGYGQQGGGYGGQGGYGQGGYGSQGGGYGGYNSGAGGWAGGQDGGSGFGSYNNQSYGGGGPMRGYSQSARSAPYSADQRGGGYGGGGYNKF